MRALSTLLAALSIFPALLLASSTCRPNTISLPLDALPGAFITNIHAEYIKSRPTSALPPYFTADTLENACEVFISYIYPGTNSSETTITVWLPDQWNERFMGTGGGAWQVTLGEAGMILPYKDGYATALSNGGLTGSPWDPTYTMLSPGNPNKAALERLGHRSIHEMTVLAKMVIKSYYGKVAKTNIYTGCSTGGRQALMEASRYPDDYDGIVAGAPAGHFMEIIFGALAAPALMAQSNYYPSPCEMLAISKAAVSACDGLDGKVDGLVSRPDLCKFHAASAVGLEYTDECPGGQGGQGIVTKEGAKIMQQIMEGIHASNGEKMTNGFVWGTEPWFAHSLANTKIDSKTGQRIAAINPLAQRFLHDYILQGADSIDYSRLTVDKVQEYLREAKRQYDYDLEPFPDLTKFAQRGGKILSYHGLEDSVISPYNSLRKYTEIQHQMFPRHNLAQATEQMHNFWRLFFLPGTQHCAPYPGRPGPSAKDCYRHVTRWVEQGIAPDTFQAYNQSSSPYSNMCLWPSKPYWRKDVLECQSGISTWDAYPTFTEVVTTFFELLPGWLLLDPKPEDLRPKNDL